MRGALEPFDVEITDLKPDETKFKVKFDPKKTDLTEMLAAMEAKGESAKKID